MDREAVKARWLPVGIVALVLLALNVIGRWVAKFLSSDGGPDAATREEYAGLAFLSSIFLVFAVMAVIWGRNRPLGRVVTDLIVAAVLGCALSIFIGPLLAGISPFSGGAGQFFAQIWWFGGLALAGGGLGVLGLIAVGQDHRAKQLKAYANRARRA